MPKKLTLMQQAKSKPWYKRAAKLFSQSTKSNETVRTAVEYMDEDETIIGLFPTIREIDGKLVKLSRARAIEEANKNKDFVKVPDFTTGNTLSKELSKEIGVARSILPYTERFKQARNGKK